MSKSTREINLNIMVGDIEVEKATVSFLNIPLKSPFRISLGTITDYGGTIVELHSGQLSGYGEGSTVPEITGESPFGIFETVCYIFGRMRGKRYQGIEEFLYDVYKSIFANPAAKSAIDVALHDLVAKHYGIHVTDMLGGSRGKMHTSLTIGIGSVGENIKELEELKQSGATVIKIKVGNNADQDIERINEISEHLDGIPFFADANQGYNLRDGIRVAKVLCNNGALFFEQPLLKHSLSNLRELRNKGGIQIMLDESIGEPREVIDAIIADCVDLVNVKLAKSGGIRNAFKAITVAQAYGLDAMVGCMIESKLGIAASLSVASSLSNVKFTDLDGFHSLSLQPFKDGVEYAHGSNELTPGKGLACKPIRENWQIAKN